MKFKHVDLIAGCVNQDSREVKTKFSKTFDTFFLPVGDEIRGIVAEWVTYLREEKLWGNDDPPFPATRYICRASRQFEVDGLDRKCWSNATPIRHDHLYELWRGRLRAAGGIIRDLAEPHESAQPNVSALAKALAHEMCNSEIMQAPVE